MESEQTNTLVLISSAHSFFPHPFPLLSGVDVLYESPPLNPVLRFLAWRFSLRHVFPNAMQTPSFSFPRHLHHCFAHMFFSSRYMPIPLQPTFLHYLGYFSHLRCLSNSFIPNSVQLGNSTQPSQHPHFFRHIQLLLLCFLHCPCLGTVHHCWSYYRLVQNILTEPPIQWIFQFFHPDCILCVIFTCILVSILCQCRS